MQTNLQKLIAFLKDTYSVEVTIKDSIEDGIEIAELVNRSILINKQSRNDTEILFVIGHLFGHMVQFSHYEDYRHLVEKVGEPKPLQLSDDFKKAFYAYEVEGYRIGKGLMEAVLGKAEANTLDEKYQIYLETDFLTFWQYLTTGNQISVSAFNTLLLQNYIAWKGKYPKELGSIPLPNTIVFSSITAKVY